MVKSDKYQQVAIAIEYQVNSYGHTSYIVNSDREETWLPIINLFENNFCLGISQLGYWVLARDNRIIPLIDNQNLRSLLPCLQKRRDEIILLIEEALVDRNLSKEIINTFPIHELMLLALKSKSDFWALRALEWLENYQADQDITREIQQLLQEKWLSQKTRTEANKILKRINQSS